MSAMKFVLACVAAIFSGILGESSPTVSDRYVIGPEYRDDPATGASPKSGRYFNFNMSTSRSNYYDCTDATLTQPCDAQRSISVYIPHQYEDGMEAGLLVAHDDFSLLIGNIMDNLIGNPDSERSLPVFIMVQVGHAGGDGPGSARDLEYDTVSGKWADFVSEEVLPAVLTQPEIKAVFPNLVITSDPKGRASFGCSSGGAAALSMAWFRPNLFRRVAAYSATLLRKDPLLPSNETYPLGAGEYIELIRKLEKKPLRIFHHASQHDIGTNDPEAYEGITLSGQPELTREGCVGLERMGHDVQLIFPLAVICPACLPGSNLAEANNLTAASLEDRGYETRYAFARGACHCDPRVLRQDLPNTLVWLWRGWSPEYPEYV